MMKKQPLGNNAVKLTKYAFVLGSAATLIGRAGAQTAAQFTFDSDASTASSTGSNSGMLTAEVGSGTAFGVHASTSTVYSFPAGFDSANSFSSNHWTGGDYYQFNINATAFTSASISFDMYRSSTGPVGFILQYSTDGGTAASDFSAFTTFSAATVSFSTASGSTVSQYNFDLSGVTALSNDASDIFRLTSDGSGTGGAGTIGTGGTDRVDNFTFGPPAAPFMATPEPSTLALLSLAGAGIVTMAGRRRKRA